jgi:S1-C subfamily serine protease
MDVDGRNQDRLTSSGIGVGYLSCSPDGRRIAYWIEGDIFTINKDGTWNNALLSGREAYEPAWSPDGTKIAFQSWKHDPFRIEGNSEIYTMDVDGGNLVRLTDNSAYDDYPAWSPDGSKLAFISDRDGNEEIYVMNADGSNQRRLTNHNASEFFPIWSPNGTEIAFQSSRVGGGSWGIYIMDIDGTNVHSLKASISYISNAPSWSPDGETIIFSSTSDADQAEIYIMDKDGSNVIRLTTNLVNDVFPRWVPRKKGIDVNEDSLIIPDASTLKAMTTRIVTDQARSAVVRIKTSLGLGSGFIIDPDGLIMTNNHVISDAKEITVHLEDGTSYPGTIRARDLVRDLAIVKIKATELPFLEIGDLSEIGLGQQVLVLGYPLGVENIVVTSGLVSTIDFDIGRNITWVQTDSAINLGNSGGPMLDLRGKVIGIVSAKLIGAAVEGIGFAISANTVNLYLPRLEAGETIRAFD